MIWVFFFYVFLVVLFFLDISFLYRKEGGWNSFVVVIGVGVGVRLIW